MIAFYAFGEGFLQEFSGLEKSIDHGDAVCGKLDAFGMGKDPCPALFPQDIGKLRDVEIRSDDPASLFEGGLKQFFLIAGELTCEYDKDEDIGEGRCN